MPSRPLPATIALAAVSFSLLMPRVAARAADAHDHWTATSGRVESGAESVTIAIVLDARTGRTLSRVAAGPGQTNLAFSPDGSRAVFFGLNLDGPACAVEVRTSDFAPLRTIHGRASDGSAVDVQAAYYGADGALYAVLGQYGGSARTEFRIVRAGRAGEPPAHDLYHAVGTWFCMSADRRVGFVYTTPGEPEWPGGGSATVEVVDLIRFSTLATYAVRDADLDSGFEPNFDGSELRVLGDVSRIRVLDARTGKIMREESTGWPAEASAYLANDCSGGRSLLMHVSLEGDGDAYTGSVWLTSGGAIRGPAASVGLDTGVERYAVDEAGTRLSVFGSGPRPIRSFRIRRPAGATGLVPSALHATPDGARLILVFALPEDDC